MLLRGFIVWLLIIFAESLHGTARVLLLEPYVGDLRARQIAFFTGMAIILAIAMAFIKWIRAKGFSQLLAVGALWAALTLVFEALIGKVVFHYSWKRILADYDLSAGGLMALGIIFLVFAPLIAARARS